MRNRYYKPKFTRPEDFVNEFNKIYDSAEKCAELLSVGTYDHTIEKHQNLTNDDLTKRFHDEKGKPYLSTFYVPAEGLWWSAVRTKLNDIAKWYVDYKPGDETNNKKQMYDFNIIFPNLVGHGLDAANRSDYDCRVANFVITRGSQGIGIRCITAHPAIERSISLEHDVSKADKVSSIGHFCYEKHFCIDLESELAAAKDDVGKKFAAIASVMNNWKPEKEKDKGQRCYYDQFDNSLYIMSGKEDGVVALNDRLQLSGTLYKDGKALQAKPTTIKKHFPELIPYVDRMTELVCMAKSTKRVADHAETISTAEDAGTIRYLDTAHPVDGLLNLETEAKVNVIFQDIAEARDGYILQTDYYKNKQKDQRTIFVDKETGDRTPLAPDGFGIEYTVKEYDSEPGPNAGERETIPQMPLEPKTPIPTKDRGTRAQSFDER